MTGKEFFRAVANGHTDFIQLFLELLDSGSVGYCVIGGLAVNAYADPIVSLDLDIVVVSANIGWIRVEAVKRGLKVEEFEHSMNFSAPGSDLRIQVQKDQRYQDFLAHAMTKTILGYDMQVAAVEDVLRGKLWAYADETRRKSKRQKDLADIFRLIETHPHLTGMVPAQLLA